MLPKFSIKRPVTTIMCIFIVLLGGIIAYTSLSLDLMPSINVPVAIVSTSYPGAGPEEIETLVTKPIEDALGTVSNIDSLSSTSSAGSSTVIIYFEDSTDIDMAALDMREKIDMVKGRLPEGASEPMVMKIDIASMTAIYMGVRSDSLSLAELNTMVEDTIIKRFEKIEGIASVSTMGGINEEVQITVNPEKMEGYGVTTSMISQALASENINYPVGSVTQGTVSMQIKTEGKFTSVDEIRQLPLTTMAGAIISIEDVADVRIATKDQVSYANVEGEAAIVLVIQKQSNANLVDISDKVIAEMNRVSQDYEQIETSMLSDTSSYIKTSVNNIVSTAFQAAVLAIAVIFIFLRSAKMSLIVGISIPTSIIATFAAMWFSGMSMNMISMGGIAIGIGMVVDNSIVVLENIYTHMKRNPDPKVASEIGANKVAMAVTASTLTTMGVFVPLMFVTGIVGDIFWDLSLTICFSLLASLVVSLTFVPMACSKLLKPEMFVDGKEVVESKHFGKLLDKWGHLLGKIDVMYGKILQWSLLHKKRVVTFSSLFFVATMLLVIVMGMDLMPEMDEGVLEVRVEMPSGTDIEETEAVVNEVFGRMDNIPEVDNYYAFIGNAGGMFGGSSNTATIGANLVAKKERNVTAKELARQLEEDFANIAGCEVTVLDASGAMGAYGNARVTVRVSGDDSDILRDVGYDLKERFSQIDGVINVENSAGEGLPEARIVVDRAKASVYGISTAQISSTISSAINGTVATKYTMNGTEIDVRIKQDKKRVSSINDIKNLTVMTSQGVLIPVAEVADIVMGESAVNITRVDGYKYMDISVEYFERDMNAVSIDVKAKADAYVFPDGYGYEITGNSEDMIEAFTQLLLVLVVAILLIYMIMASQFESFIHPFIVMFSIPIALSGGVLGLFITGKSITVIALMGFIMLVGIVVNNAIVLIDAANQKVESGMSTFEAISQAGPERLRPILMTTLTTVLGMVPLGMGMGEGMEMQQPMAITIIFGLSLSTIVTLILIPVLYMVVDILRSKERRPKLFKKSKKKEDLTLES